MAFSGKLAYLLVLALLVAVTFGEVFDDDLTAEEVDALELSEQVRQEEEPPAPVTDGDPETQSQGIAPQGFRTRFPSRTCGVFILCERQDGFNGAPGAKLFEGSTGDFFVRSKGDCRSLVVKGKCKRKTRRNHAKLWPVNREEFDELCFYFERKHTCKRGTVEVVKKVDGAETVLHSCTPAFDAHSVRFCMYKDPKQC